MGVTRGRDTPRRKVNSGCEPLAVGLVRVRGPLQVDEVLQHRLAERRQPDDHARRQAAGIEREVAAAEARRAAERGGDVPHRGEVPHLLDRDAQDGAAPARRRLGFRGRRALPRSRCRLNAA